ncbi:SIR2-like domain-containing protein [Xylariaceae sp. FL1019]|nr:SIR2-like domain-containing protein [Xylariaceae sp. FL1019]
MAQPPPPAQPAPPAPPAPVSPRTRMRAEEERIQNEAVDVLRERLRTNQLAICVGSGVSLFSAPSQAARLSWWGLMNNALDYFENQAAVLARQEPHSTNLATARTLLAKQDPTEAERDSVCSLLMTLLRVRSDLESAWLRDQFKNLYKTYVTQHAILDSLRTLHQHGAMLFTTNYDDLLERHCNIASIDGSDRVALAEYRRGERSGVFHPHGFWKNAEHIVLDPIQYWHVKRKPPVQETLQHILMSRTVLFVGCGGGLADPNFGPLITWAGRQNHETTIRNYILLERNEANPVTQLPLIHLRAEGFDDIARFLATILGPEAQREGTINETPESHERRKIHDWLAPEDQSRYLNDLSNQEGPARFDRYILNSQDIWQLNRPSRVWLRGTPGVGKTMFCSSVINNTNCQLETYQRARDNLAYFFCQADCPYSQAKVTDKSHGSRNPRSPTFNTFLRTIISQLCPPNFLFPGLRELYFECTRHHPVRLPTNAELQDVLLRLLQWLNEPRIRPRQDAKEPGETYMVIDAIDGLPVNIRDDYSRFIRVLAGQQLQHLHLLVSTRTQNPGVIGNVAQPRPSKRGGKPQKKRTRIEPARIAGMTQWHEITLDERATRTAIADWVRDRVDFDPSLAVVANDKKWILDQFRESHQKQVAQVSLCITPR